MQITTLFDALSDTTRRQILSLLIRQQECCVCTLYETLNLSQPKISRHLAVLREAGLVQTRRDGLWVHYSLNPELPDWASTVLSGMAQGEGLTIANSGVACRAMPTKASTRRRAHA